MTRPPIATGLFSLWTKPPQFALERGPLIVHTLAVCLAWRAFPCVELVTDRRGRAIAEAMGWQFANVRDDLEQLSAPPHVWAAGKLEALRLVNRPAVHIDGDALILSGRLPDPFLAGRLVAQEIDRPSFYNGRAARRARDIAQLPAGAVAFNAGLIGGADVELVRTFAGFALDCAHRFHGREGETSGTAASMVCEQYGLGCFAAERGVLVETLEKSDDYAHLAGDHKRSWFYVDASEAMLRNQFPEAYRRAMAGLSTLCPVAL